jgi:hypothetical protein
MNFKNLRYIWVCFGILNWLKFVPMRPVFVDNGPGSGAFLLPGSGAHSFGHFEKYVLLKAHTFTQ